MARSVYVTGIGRGDGRQVVELGLMELLSRRSDRVGVFRPLTHRSADDMVELLRSRYRIELAPGLLYGMDYEAAAALRAERGQDELVSVLVDRFRRVERHCEAVLVLGTDFADTNIPDELALNARLANEFGALVVAVVGGNRQNADTVAAEARNAERAYAGLGCNLLALVANRVPAAEREATLRQVEQACAVPAYVLPEDPALAAPTVAEVVAATGGTVLLGDADGLDRDVRGYVLGGAMLPHFLDALHPGALVVTPGDRADLLIGALAAHAAGSPALAGVLLTMGETPDPQVMDLAARLGAGTPVAVVPELSFATAQLLAPLEGRITATAPRKAESALGLFDLHVDVPALTARIELDRPQRITPMMFEHELIERARTPRLAQIVLAEGTEERILRAADVLVRRNVCHLTLLGSEPAIRRKLADLGLDLGLDLAADPKTDPRGEIGAEAAADPAAGSTDEPAQAARARVRVVDPTLDPRRERLAEVYAALRRHKGVTLDQALDTVVDVNHFGTMLVHQGLADGMVSGAVHSTASTLRPALEVIKTAPGAGLVSSVFFMCLPDRVLVYGDCAINPDPDAEQLADIAVQCARTAEEFGVPPRVALLSYSTGTSGHGADVDKVREAAAIVRRLRPDLPVEGPIQYDAAIEPAVAATKLPDSPVAGKATVFVFPDLNTGNNTYKAVQRSANALAIGPVLQGLRKPINDLSRGATVQDIVTTVAITAIQAHRQREAEARAPHEIGHEAGHEAGPEADHRTRATTVTG
ncbi:phosphate acetyltransferase [Actinospica durhamensis]|uniref:Phosphate acetyltransferase n=1 Tax=Actinospica durhamensis TaxID=1508375 RepID=A0A941ISJ2_9ACTN|nr:phosphate acetyltransferase [Actinospica durhamensis]MBR7836427.1 phosphate acetyltransferase [Actinospica durhamensis]